VDHKAAEDLAKMADWTEDSLGYAREHGQRKLGWLLEAVRVEVKLENAWLALPLGEHLGPERGGAREKTVQENERATDKAHDVLKQKRDEERSRARLVEWELFMRAELRELELRKGGQLARLLGEPLPGEPPAALERLASEDQRQAEEGLVALMRNGKVSYKHVDELAPEDRPARIAANRARAAWLKERRDVWCSSGGPSISAGTSLFASAGTEKTERQASPAKTERGREERGTF
jgi:hypothetical protein